MTEVIAAGLMDRLVLNSLIVGLILSMYIHNKLAASKKKKKETYSLPSI